MINPWTRSFITEVLIKEHCCIGGWIQCLAILTVPILRSDNYNQNQVTNCRSLPRMLTSVFSGWAKNGTIWGEFPYWVWVFPFQSKVTLNRLGQFTSNSKTTHCQKTQRKKYTSINIDHNYVGIHMCPGILCTSPDCLMLVPALVLSNWRGWIQLMAGEREEGLWSGWWLPLSHCPTMSTVRRRIG